MIERIHLTILREISLKGSLTAASESLHLTQSAVSHAIKKLERHLGTPLWQKNGRAIRFTQAGEYLLSVANRLVPQLEHADMVMTQYAGGERAALRIGMECHPCYQWLLRVVSPYLEAWPSIDVDVKQRFQFGGMAALFSYDIDILVTPDPLQKPGVHFVPVFDYELVLAVSRTHRLAGKKSIDAKDLMEEVLFTYPVDIDRLDIYTELLIPQNCSPKKRKTIEATDIMMQLVSAGRGVAALPRWLVDDYAQKMGVCGVSLCDEGIAKQIHLGVRDGEQNIHYLQAFLSLANSVD